MLSVTPIPALSDNYIWLLRQDSSPAVCVVDPGESGPVIDHMERESLTLESILITHHHPDHTGGLEALIKRYSPKVIGPDNPDIEGITDTVGEGDQVRVMGRLFDVFATPGHTLDHISFFAPGIPPLLFCGDTLFCAGCGRLFEGTPEQMHQALNRFAQLPEETLVFAGHEYTLANLKFARHWLPDDTSLKEFEARCQKLREDGKPTVPSILGDEKRLNPFLRWDDKAVIDAANHHTPEPVNSDNDVFAATRRAKDTF